MTSTTYNTSRNNNFGLIRLGLASLVVVSHSSELIDGDRHREMVSRIFNSLSLGEVAVSGFFLVSGFLITRSFVDRRSTGSFLLHRLGRIVPAYGVCFALCSLVIGPRVGATDDPWSLASLGGALTQIVRLLPPVAPGAFHGLPYPYLNGAMWTLAYEFRCYIVVLCLGLIGRILSLSRYWLAGLVVTGLALDAASILHASPSRYEFLVGNLESDVRFGSVFGVGALFFLFRDTIRPTRNCAATALMVLLLCLQHDSLAIAGVAVAGGVLLFWLALQCRVPPAARWANTTDISYGLYLYAWPIQNLLIWHDRTIGPVALRCLALPAAAALGFASWTLVERPASRLVRRLARRPAEAATIGEGAGSEIPAQPTAMRLRTTAP